jgi:hypothetical protein
MAFDLLTAKANLRKAGMLATSDSPQSHQELYGLLNSNAFLYTLEPEENYLNGTPRGLKVARVIKTLMKSPHPIARETLVRLIRAQEFTSHELLEDLLTIALVAVRPLPPLAISYLESQSTPESAGLHLVMNTLAVNESEPALKMFERKIADSTQEPECRIIWLRAEYLVRRNDVPILQSYRRMIVESAVPPEMQIYALESLCSYDWNWYLACSRPEPPLRLFASAEAKKILREILLHAKDKMRLSPELELAVQTASLEIGEK